VENLINAAGQQLHPPWIPIPAWTHVASSRFVAEMKVPTDSNSNSNSNFANPS